jgi:hypothetical protein
MYDVTATANAAAEHYNPMVAGPVQRIWSESVYTTPDPVASYDEATLTITAQPGEGSPEGTVVAIYVGNQKVVEGVGTQTYVIRQTEDDQYLAYYATATAPEATADVVYPGMSSTEYAFVPAMPKDFQGTVSVSVDENGNVTATYALAEGEEDADITVTCNPSHLDSYGENIPVVVTVAAEGYNTKTYNETVNYTEPQQPEQTTTPNIRGEEFLWHTSELNNTAYSVTITCDDADAVIEYCINGGDWMTYDGKFILHGQDGDEFVVEARATAPGKTVSNLATETYKVEGIPTSIDEIMSAENVANVRFFNVAGQEMQEANGLTIVVVTFTDGKTMTTKVMK